jgi:hypothetical protein
MTTSWTSGLLRTIEFCPGTRSLSSGRPAAQRALCLWRLAHLLGGKPKAMQRGTDPRASQQIRNLQTGWSVHSLIARHSSDLNGGMMRQAKPVELTPSEEIALRRIAVGNARPTVLKTSDLEYLTSLELAAMRGSSLVLTHRGERLVADPLATCWENLSRMMSTSRLLQRPSASYSNSRAARADSRTDCPGFTKRSVVRFESNARR